jgi:hypothetical protein
MAKRSVIRRGRKAISDVGSGAGDFVKIADGDAIDMVSIVDMEEILSVDQHAIWLEGGNSPMFPCIGKGCPGCELGNQPRFRAFLPVKLIESGDSKIFSFGIQIARALEELDEEFGGLAGNVFRVKRKGSGLATTYTVVALGKKRKVSEDDIPEDLEEKIGPTTRKTILDLLEETGAIEDIVEEEELEEEDEEEEEEEPTLSYKSA